MTTSAEVQLFPAACPSCQAIAGFPYMASTEPGAIRVAVRCRGCQHEWELRMSHSVPKGQRLDPVDR